MYKKLSKMVDEEKEPTGSVGGKNMNKTELINTLAFDKGLTHQESRDILNYIFKLMADSLAAGEPVSITDFCSFRVVDRPARRYRHNTTGRMMEVPAGKRVKVSMSDSILRRVDPAFDAEKVEVEE